MTDISVVSTGYQAEKRSWLLSQHGTDPGANPGITLDASLFTAGTHFPNGYLPSGTAISPAGGPYSGTGACAGILFSSVRFATPTSKVGGALVRHGFVKTSKLPFSSGTGSLGAGGAAALPLIDFS
ncbi:head decoration protein [Nocardioides aurantiacus]|uniref:Bacteriophage lambda head decoration protein D n=1 Tax=Nocardioides aurantiacus TaxID=86796 RepID=A0A3N2CWA4_9ACTN|nr:head decoration protein [Nocardioides aurantiacus]ROR91763.1 hypothetical protein EDD33_2638 [Nocardioides aurantiacus]